MSTLEQVIENAETADISIPGILTQKELELLDRVAQKYNILGFLGCTGCRYCMPCPQGVNIPQILLLYNEYHAKGRGDKIKKKYLKHISPESQAKRCTICERCEKLCPQHLPIGEILGRATWIFDEE